MTTEYIAERKDIYTFEPKQRSYGSYYLYVHENRSIDEEVLSVYRKLLCQYVGIIRSQKNLNYKDFIMGLKLFLNEKSSHFFWGYEIKGIAFYGMDKKWYSYGTIELLSQNKVIIDGNSYSLESKTKHPVPYNSTSRFLSMIKGSLWTYLWIAFIAAMIYYVLTQLLSYIL
jgi:hypothetical protein